MVQISVRYDGRLRCTAEHGPSKSTLFTDAPVDNHGRGEAFSPTDLVATALGTCMLTIMGIHAERHAIDLAGARATVEKVMSTTPPRRIARLVATIELPLAPDHPHRGSLEAAAHACPVHKSLHPEIDAPVEFVWKGSR